MPLRFKSKRVSRRLRRWLRVPSSSILILALPSLCGSALDSSMGQEQSSGAGVAQDIINQSPSRRDARMDKRPSTEEVDRDVNAGSKMVRPPTTGEMKLKAGSAMVDENSPQVAAYRRSRGRGNSYVVVGPDGSLEVFGTPAANANSIYTVKPVSTSPASYARSAA